MKKLALLLSVVMILIAVPAIQVEARSGHDNQGQVMEFPFDFSHEQAQSQRTKFISSQYEPLETFDYTNGLGDDVAISEARQKYNLLRVGNYTRIGIINRFHELFGYMSPEYILQNYMRIFDITSAEVDEVILDILTRDQYQFTDQMLLDSVAALRPARVPSMTGAAIHIDYKIADDFHRGFDLVEVEEKGISALEVGAHSLNIVSTTSNSIAFNVTFPVAQQWGNIVEYWDWNKMRWEDATGRGEHAISGTYTISNLTTGGAVLLWSNYFDSSNGTEGAAIYRDVRLPLPPQALVNHSRSSVDFALDRALLDVWGPARASRFMDATNRAYYIMHDLVGGPRPPRMRLESTRSLPWGYEGEAGWPMLWQTTEPTGEGLVAIDQAHAMVRLNADTTETPLHEMAHNFENQRWLFEAEALVIFKIYYYYVRTNERMAVAGYSRAWQGGNDYRTYMRSYADRVFGHIDHDRAMELGVYSPYAMAYTLARIQTRTGWEPFYSTFRYFHNMHPAAVPASRIDRLNLFLTKLRDFSNVDVMTTFSARERQVYENYFGGQLRYMPEITVREWRVFTDTYLDTERLVTTVPVESIGQFRNVHIGVSRRINASVGDAFVFSDGRWQSIGSWEFIQPLGGQEQFGLYGDLIPLQGIVPLNMPVWSGIRDPIHNPFTHAHSGSFTRFDITRIVRQTGMTGEAYNAIRRLIEFARNFQELSAIDRDLNEIFEDILRHRLGNALSDDELMMYFRLFNMIARILTDSASIEERYRFNSSLLRSSPILGYVHGQWNEPQSLLEIGAEGTGESSGCGAFAIHNAMFYSGGEWGMPQTAQIIRELEQLGGFNLHGALGINPIVVEEFLENMNYNPRSAKLPLRTTSGVDTPIINSMASILLYYGDATTYIHYVMIRHDGTQFLIYNLFGNGDRAVPVPSIADWMINTGYRPLVLTTLEPTMRFQPIGLGEGRVGEEYRGQLRVASGGTVRWRVIRDFLPRGLTLNRITGVISGTPETPGVSRFTVQAYNGRGQYFSHELSISIWPNITLPFSRAALGEIVAFTETVYVNDPEFSPPLSQSVLQSALTVSNHIYNDTQSTSDEFEGAAHLLIDTVNTILDTYTDPQPLPEHKTTLNTAIQQAATLTQTDFTPASWQALQQTLTTAQSVYNYPNATAHQLSAMANIVNTAVDIILPGQGQQQPVGVNSWIELRAAIDAAPANVPTTIYIGSSFEAPSGTSQGNQIMLPANRDITLVSTNTAAGEANVRVITQTNPHQRHFWVEGNLTLGPNITLSGGTPGNNNRSGGVRVNPGGTLTMNDGSIIENCRGAVNGGGVELSFMFSANNGSDIPAMLNLSGGIIRNNAASSGGGVSGTIHSQINMTSGSITGNEAVGHNGGGIAIGVTGTTQTNVNFKMTGGSITNNRSTLGGGAIWTFATQSWAPVVPYTAFTNIYIGENAVFYGNVSDQGASAPPFNRLAHISAASSSIWSCVLNNYDIGYVGRLGLPEQGVTSWEELRSVIDAVPANFPITIPIENSFAAPDGWEGRGIGINAGRQITLVSTETAPGMDNERVITQTNNGQLHFGVSGDFTLGKNITLSGGAVNNTNNSGGVSVGSGGTFTMLDGSVIENCWWTRIYLSAITLGGRGVGQQTRATFNMLGGTIRNNTSPNGGGVHFREYFENNRMNMSGGSIEYNEAINAGVISSVIQGRGGGIWIRNGQVAEGTGLYMTGGRIANNRAYRDGGGIYTNDALPNIQLPITAYSSIFIGPDAEFYGNRVNNGVSAPPDNTLPHISPQAQASVWGYILNNYDINYTGRLGVSLRTLNFQLNGTQENPTNPITIVPINVVENTSIKVGSGFPSAPERDDYTFVGWYLDYNFTIRLDEATLMPTADTTLFARWEGAFVEAVIITVSTEQALRQAANNAGTTPTIIELAADITLNPFPAQLNIPNGVTLTLRSVDGAIHALTANGNFQVITVGGNVDLTLQNVEITRTLNTRGNGIINGGTLTILDGTAIVGHTHHVQGAGIHNEMTGTINMHGGVISGNITEMVNNNTGGAGVFNLGTFTMTGGYITDNTTAGVGGGVLNRGDFIMKGGEISDNTSTESGGAGVANGTGSLRTGNFHMHGGVISGNTAVLFGAGGGIENASTQDFIMFGGRIENNHANGGGGVFNRMGSTFVMEGGEIVGNDASNIHGSGGGISCQGTFIMRGGAIRNNTTNGGGGGIIKGWGDFIMEGGEISGNVAVGSGGGVILTNWSPTFTMHDGIISGNQGAWGGGVVNNNGNTFTMFGGVIKDNVATVTDGGGVHNAGAFIMHNGIISGNTTVASGGGINNLGSFTMNSGEISGNIAQNNGGGILISNINTLTQSQLNIGASAVFANNSAGTSQARNPAYEAAYYQHIHATQWTQPFTQGFNNYDIGFSIWRPFQAVSIQVDMSQDGYAEDWYADTDVDIDTDEVDVEYQFVEDVDIVVYYTDKWLYEKVE